MPVCLSLSLWLSTLIFLKKKKKNLFCVLKFLTLIWELRIKEVSLPCIFPFDTIFGSDSGFEFCRNMPCTPSRDIWNLITLSQSHRGDQDGLSNSPKAEILRSRLTVTPDLEPSARCPPRARVGSHCALVLTGGWEWTYGGWWVSESWGLPSSTRAWALFRFKNAE